MTTIYIIPEFFRIDDNCVVYLEKFEYLRLDEQIDVSKKIHRKRLQDEGVLINKPSLQQSKEKKGRMLILEPHPDDFALSCMPYGLEALGAGRDITLLNIFSKGTLETFPWRDKIKIDEVTYESLRLYESGLVAKLIGVAFRSLRFPMAIQRGYPTPFEQPDARDDALAQELHDVLATGSYDIVVCPLGIGHHTDHLLVYDAVRSVLAQRTGVEILFYEDFPYTKNFVARTSRMDEVKELHLQAGYFDVSAHLAVTADMCSIYRSQFDDVNRIQMAGLIADHARNVAQEAKALRRNHDGEFAGRIYWRIPP